MSSLPQIIQLNVTGYELYPGTPQGAGLRRDTAPGMTLVVGANGLGKTTLVTMLRDMCAGPFRLSNRSGGTFEAGGLKTTAVDANTFADRVSDRAADATAQMTMVVSESTFVITRSLRNLRLKSLLIDGQQVDASKEQFRQAVVAAAAVPDYAHWLLLVDYLVFVTEDRAEAFWDDTVQRHLLRLLTRDAKAAGDYADAERTHISADSDYRNARVQLNRHRQRFEAQLVKFAKSGDVRADLHQLKAQQTAVAEEIAETEQALEEAKLERRASLRDYENAASELQVAQDTLDAARFSLIEAAMPSRDEVARYLSVRLATDPACPGCSREDSEIRERLLAGGLCLLCGLPYPAETAETANELADIGALEARVRHAKTAIDANADRDAVRHAGVTELQAALVAMRAHGADLDESAKALRAQLPSGSSDLDSSETFLRELESDLDRLRASLDLSRARLQEVIELGNDAVLAKQDDLKKVFDEIATAFLVERCQLVPHQTSVRIGQEGERFTLQAFDLELGNSTSAGTSRRNSRDEVSESQRTFIDIAFRIALTKACAALGAGSLVIDAPEGSLDAVFAPNAAALMFAFVSAESGNRHLFVASNLIEGSLLPSLAQLAQLTGEADPRLINLLELAAPTAAVREHSDEYRVVLRRALSLQSQDGSV